MKSFPFSVGGFVDCRQAHMSNQQWCFCSGLYLKILQTDDTLIMQSLINSPSQNGWADLAISCVLNGSFTLRFCFFKHSVNTRFLFISFTFFFFCCVFGSLSLTHLIHSDGNNRCSPVCPLVENVGNSTLVADLKFFCLWQPCETGEAGILQFPC